MTDVFSKEKRSWVMSRIRGKNTKIEIIIGDIMRSNGIRFVSHPKIFGNPDFLAGEKTAVFCDGDFWHGFRYNIKKKPESKFWRDKIEENMRRDRRVTRKLRKMGYSVVRLWEHDIKKRPNVCLNRIMHFMRSSDQNDPITSSKQAVGFHENTKPL